MLIDFALHFLKPSRDGGQLGSPHRLVEDLLAVSIRGQKCDKIKVTELRPGEIFDFYTPFLANLSKHIIFKCFTKTGRKPVDSSEILAEVLDESKDLT